MLDQPTTILGKVAVILNNDPNNPAKWSIKRIVKDITDHGWDASNTNEAVGQLLRWEILVKQADGRLKAVRSRIRVLNHEGNLQVQ